MGLYKYIKPKIKTLIQKDREVTKSVNSVLEQSEDEYKTPLVVKLLKTMKDLLCYQGVMRSEIDELNGIISNNEIDSNDYSMLYVLPNNFDEEITGYVSKIEAESALYSKIRLGELEENSKLKIVNIKHNFGECNLKCYEIKRDILTGNILSSLEIPPINEKNKNNHFVSYGIVTSQVFHTSLQNAIQKSKTKFKRKLNEKTKEEN